jgi:hypothetical protein
LVPVAAASAIKNYLGDGCEKGWSVDSVQIVSQSPKGNGPIKHVVAAVIVSPNQPYVRDFINNPCADRAASRNFPRDYITQALLEAFPRPAHFQATYEFKLEKSGWQLTQLSLDGSPVRTTP